LLPDGSLGREVNCWCGVDRTDVAVSTLRVWRWGLSRSSKEGRGRAVSVKKERVLRWVEELREEQEKTAREEARKEEILQMLGELAKLAEHQRYPSVHPLRA
jgi:hypothetical protein